MRRRRETSWLVFDAEAVTYVDSTGLEALAELVDELHRDEITLVVARLRTAMHEQFDLVGLSAKIGPEHFYPTVRAAVERSAQADRPR